MLISSTALVPRWPAVPYAIINGTASSPPPQITTPPASPGSNIVNRPPAVPPVPDFQPVRVVPAANLPTSPAHSPVAIGTVAAVATLLQGYCSEPAYTIIDGPTAIWMPIVGCIASKGDCCPTPPPSKEQGGSNGPSSQSVAQFPMSQMPLQGTLTGCPKDYHTIDGTACCPSNYWLWSTTLGGQVPCYSSLPTKMTPPPIPDTLVNQMGATGTGDDRSTITATQPLPSSASTHVSALTMTQKPTLAIVNIAYAMQFPVNPPKPKMKTGAKIGIGVGASSAAIFVAFLVWFLIRKARAHRETRTRRESAEQASVSHRFSSSVDMSRVAHHPAGVGRVHGGKKYSGVGRSSVNY